jgi:hypothetical protein
MVVFGIKIDQAGGHLSYLPECEENIAFLSSAFDYFKVIHAKCMVNLDNADVFLNNFRIVYMKPITTYVQITCTHILTLVSYT